MDGADMLIVPVRSRAPAMKRYIQMLDLRVDDVTRYLEQVRSGSNK